MSEENQESQEKPDALMEMAGYVHAEMEGFAKDLAEGGCYSPSEEALSWLAANPEAGAPLLVYWKLQEVVSVLLDIRKEMTEIRKHLGAPEPPEYP